MNLTRLWATPLLLSLLVACSSRSDEEMLQSATKRLAGNDAAGASIELKNLLQKNPENAQARRLLGQALLEAGDPSGAEIELRRSWELGGPREELAPLLAQTLLLSGQAAKVIGEFSDQTLADAGAMASLQGHLASAYLIQGNLEEAKAAAARALSLNPQSEAVVLTNVRVQMAARQPEEAMTLLDEQIARTPKSPKALLLKADILSSQGKRDEAQALFQRVLDVDPGSYDARSALLRGALAANRLDEAAKLVSAMPEPMTKKPQGRFMQAQLALAQGDAAKARDLTVPLLKILPNYLPLLRLAAAAHQQLGQMPEAESLLGQALKLAPEDASLRRQFANLQLQGRSPGKALDEIKPLLDSGRADAETLLIAGKAHLLQGNFKEADAAFTAAAKLRPDDPKLQAALALSALASDAAAPGGPGKARADAAVAQLRELAAKDASNSYDLMLVSALMRRQELPAALAAIDKLSAKMPGSPLPATLRGRVQFFQKQYPQAQASFEAATKADPAYLPAVLGLVGVEQQAGRGEAAVKRLETFLSGQPQSAPARLALAELLSRQANTGERIDKLLAEGVRLEPTEPGLRLALIDHRLRQGEVPKAAQAAQEAVAAFPQDPDVLERLARTQLTANDRAQALKSYAQLTTLAPNRAQGFLGLAQVRFLDKDYSGAEREIKRALEAEPGSQTAQRLAIQLAVRQGRHDEALAELRQRQKAHPQEAFGFLAEADLELSRQRLEPAIAALRKAVLLAQPADAPAQLFSALLAANKADEAMAFEAKWLAGHPDDRLFAVATADVLLARGDLPGALSRYEALLKASPELPALINNVAWLRSKLGKPGALELAERGLKATPDFLALRDTYSTVLAADKQFSKAVSLQRQLVEQFPDRGDFRLNLAQILLDSGDKPAAAKELEVLTRLGDKFPQQRLVEQLRKRL